MIPAKGSSRAEMAMALARWRQLAPEFCARAHLSLSNIEDPLMNWLANNQVPLKDEQRPELALSPKEKLSVCIRRYVSALRAQILVLKIQQRNLKSGWKITEMLQQL